MGSASRRWPRIAAGIGSALVLVVTGVAGVGAVAYRNFDNNLSSRVINVDGRSDASTSALDRQPLNILVTGSDIRTGDGNTAYGDPTQIEGARSDTTLLVHINSDRTSAIAVSIPRDTLVDIPSCPQWLAPPSEPVPQDRINEAFRIGGVGCTIKTVEELTDVPIDHFVVVDFNGFKGVVEAIDGVEVCLTEAVDDPLSGLKLDAGTHVVKGEDALAFVRARYTLGDGSDISRIDRQQAFLASAVRKATSLGVLANPVTTYKLLDEATKSLFTDTGLGSLADLTSLAVSMSDMRPSDVTFVTAPHYYNPDGATVSINQTAAAPLWQAMREDTSWPPSPTVPNGDDEPLSVAPEQIEVRVVNGTGVPGVATQAAEQLTRNGYTVVEVGDYAQGLADQTAVISAADQREAARTLAYAAGAGLNTVGDAQAALINPAYYTDTPTALTLVIGPDFEGLRAVFVQPQATTEIPTVEPPTDPGAPVVPPTTGRDASEVICS
jgi:LCP family protein required for cell wall assembly